MSSCPTVFIKFCLGVFAWLFFFSFDSSTPAGWMRMFEGRNLCFELCQNKFYCAVWPAGVTASVSCKSNSFSDNFQLSSLSLVWPKHHALLNNVFAILSSLSSSDILSFSFVCASSSGQILKVRQADEYSWEATGKRTILPFPREGCLLFLFSHPVSCHVVSPFTSLLWKWSTEGFVFPAAFTTPQAQAELTKAFCKCNQASHSFPLLNVVVWMR